eukprot:scaffold33721_cov196-Skeletonema_dohrnii-CCMP3373.AAC.1
MGTNSPTRKKQKASEYTRSTASMRVPKRLPFWPLTASLGALIRSTKTENIVNCDVTYRMLHNKSHPQPTYVVL